MKKYHQKVAEVESSRNRMNQLPDFKSEAMLCVHGTHLILLGTQMNYICQLPSIRFVSLTILGSGMKQQ